MCIAGVKKSSQSCSWSASCGTASSTSASSPGAAPQPPADLPQGTHPADNSQLSAVTAVSACASEAAQPDQADAPGQGWLAEPLRVAETASCTAGFESQAVDGAVALNKAGLLVQCLMDTRAVLALLGFNTGKAQLAEHKLALQTQTEAPIQQTQAAQVSQPGPKPAVSLSTAVAPPSGEVPKAPVMHQLTKPSQATANSDAERPQQQACTASQGFESSLLALLGLVGAAEGSRRGADGTGLAKADEEEEAGVRMARLAGSAAEVIEVLLDALLTQPEVSLDHRSIYSHFIKSFVDVTWLQAVAVSAATLIKAYMHRHQQQSHALVHECTYVPLLVFMLLCWHLSTCS